MRKREIEFWTIQVADRLKSGQPLEDSRVELKREYPLPEKAARRLAGHANAARGDEILWLIGLDEKARQVVGASGDDLLGWWTKVQAEFDDVIPPMQDLVVPVEGTAIVALQFETDRAPFVVRNPQGGAIGHEIPWRDGTAVRSARRVDLLRLLLPRQRLPLIEVLNAELTCSMPTEQHPDYDWLLGVMTYFVPVDTTELVFPMYRCTAHVLLREDRLQLDDLSFDVPEGKALARPHQLEVLGPSPVTLTGRRNSGLRPIGGPVVVDIVMHPAGSERSVNISVEMEQDAPAEGWEAARWVLKR